MNLRRRRKKSLFKFFLFTYLPRFILRPTLLAIDFFWRKVFHLQSDEELLLDEAINLRNVNSREIYFFEFGFGPTEFNCARLSHRGVSAEVIDQKVEVVKIARKILNKNTRVLNSFLKPSDLDNVFKLENFNVISIDVDGVDYEFASVAFLQRPDIMICEYNSVFGDMRVKVPYSENFNRSNFHGNFHGASLLAFVDLAHDHGYCLWATSASAVNAFFVPSTPGPIDCVGNLKAGLTKNSLGIKSKFGEISWQRSFEELRDLPIEYLNSSSSKCQNL